MPGEQHHFSPRTGAETHGNFFDALRSEKVGGLLLLAATVAALVWANSPASDSYFAIKSATFGPESLDLKLSVGQWASDGLLTVFFFVTGLELKREFVVGDLRKPSTAIVPICAAIGGMIVPAFLYLGINTALDGGVGRGWAIPTATDIAFAVCVLGIAGKWLPTAIRTFLLTLAVTDDLLAIIVIAVAFTSQILLVALAASLAAILAFGWCARRRFYWALLPLGIIAWATMHASGIHATIAGVAMGFAVPALSRHAGQTSPAENLERRIRPISSGIAVPLFALFTAGVLVDSASLRGLASDPIALGVVAGLVIGKPIGITAATVLVTSLTPAKLNSEMSRWDVVAVGMVGGIGFTVSLLIGELSFGNGTEQDSHVILAVLVGSLFSAGLGSVAFASRSRTYAKRRHA